MVNRLDRNLYKLRLEENMKFDPNIQCLDIPVKWKRPWSYEKINLLKISFFSHSTLHSVYFSLFHFSFM